MAEYIFASQQDSHRQPRKDDAETTRRMKYVRQLASNRGTVLFVGTKRQRAKSSPTRRSAAACPLSTSLAGRMLTQLQDRKVSIKRLKDLEQMAGMARSDRMTKREALSLKRTGQAQQEPGRHQGHERAAGCDLRHRRRLSQDRRDRSKKLGTVGCRGRHEPLAEALPT